MMTVISSQRGESAGWSHGYLETPKELGELLARRTENRGAKEGIASRAGDGNGTGQCRKNEERTPSFHHGSVTWQMLGKQVDAFLEFPGELGPRLRGPSSLFRAERGKHATVPRMVLVKIACVVLDVGENSSSAKGVRSDLEALAESVLHGLIFQIFLIFEVGVKAAVAEPKLRHEFRDADSFKAVLAKLLRSSLHDLGVSLLLVILFVSHRLPLSMMDIIL